MILFCPRVSHQTKWENEIEISEIERRIRTRKVESRRIWARANFIETFPASFRNWCITPFAFCLIRNQEKPKKKGMEVQYLFRNRAYQTNICPRTFISRRVKFLQIPLSTCFPGLFHRVIMMSGSAFSSWALVDDPVHYAVKLAAALNCSIPRY